MPSHFRRRLRTSHLNQFELRLAGYRAGRMLLHVVAFTLSRRNFRWHFCGVLRELGFNPPNPH